MAERMPGFFDIEDRLRELSAKGDDLERVKALVDFEDILGGVRSGSPRSTMMLTRNRGADPMWPYARTSIILHQTSAIEEEDVAETCDTIYMAGLEHT